MRVVLIDEQPLVREGFASMLRQEPGVLFCGAASNAREGWQLLDREQPDVVVLEMALSGQSGAAAAREVRRRWPHMGIVFLCNSCCERDVLDGLECGALGYLSKRDPVQAVMNGLRAAARGERYLGPSVRALSLPPVIPGDGTHWHPSNVLGALSLREREVFELVIRGFRNREIARELCIAVKTVGSHRLQINRKLGCSSVSELMFFAASNGLLPSPVNGHARPRELPEQPAELRSAV
jgi:DNA-binding NarL/FixJ family response regulator